jgi:hypothetical protein
MRCHLSNERDVIAPHRQPRMLAIVLVMLLMVPSATPSSATTASSIAHYIVVPASPVNPIAVQISTAT